MSRIVVGVDGSPGADAALRFAVDEAKARNAELLVVAAWSIPTAAYSGGYAPAGLDDDLEKFTRSLLDQALERVEPPADLEVGTKLVHGQPAEAILEAGDGADMIVVGSRGRGGFKSLLLGSVSQQVAQHARVPVTIVPTLGNDE